MGQSTDKTAIDTNPKTPRLIRSHFFQFSLSAQATGFSGSESFTFEDLALNKQSPKVEVVHAIDAGQAVRYRNCPYVKYNSAGAIYRNCYFEVDNISFADTVKITVHYYALDDTAMEFDSAMYPQNFYIHIYTGNVTNAQTVS